MNSHPIIFDGESVRAILAGTKTQTRRVVKPQPEFIESSARWCWPLPARARFKDCCTEVVTASREWWEYAPKEAYPYGAGDKLWVREAHYRFTGCAPEWESFVSAPTGDPYQARCYDDSAQVKEARFVGAVVRMSPIHMPRWASRITLRVTDVRVERVQEITEADAIAEGCKAVVWSDPPWWQGYVELDDGELLHQQARGEQPPDWMIEPHKMRSCAHMDTSARQSFACRWISINAKRGFGWDVNPWVWVVSFEVQS